MKISPHAQSKEYNDSTLMVSFFCLGQCFVELLADSNLGVSPLFRLFVFISIAVNFLTAFISCENSVPSKIRHCLIGFILFSTYSAATLLLGRDSFPELVHDLMLCQYYAMVLWTLVLGVFF